MFTAYSKKLMFNNSLKNASSPSEPFIFLHLYYIYTLNVLEEAKMPCTYETQTLFVNAVPNLSPPESKSRMENQQSDRGFKLW